MASTLLPSWLGFAPPSSSAITDDHQLHDNGTVYDTLPTRPQPMALAQNPINNLNISCFVNDMANSAMTCSLNGSAFCDKDARPNGSSHSQSSLECSSDTRVDDGMQLRKPLMCMNDAQNIKSDIKPCAKLADYLGGCCEFKPLYHNIYRSTTAQQSTHSTFSSSNCHDPQYNSGFDMDPSSYAYKPLQVPRTCIQTSDMTPEQLDLQMPGINEVARDFPTVSLEDPLSRAHNNQSLSLSMSMAPANTRVASTLVSCHEQNTTMGPNRDTICVDQATLAKKTTDISVGQRTSIYRGVTKHRWTGRYEAHLWDNSSRRAGQTRKGRQGGYDKEEKAARAYDLAALKYWGINTTLNFPLSDYEKQLEEMKIMTRQDFVASLRRHSSGFSRGASKYRGVTRHHQHGRWQARIGRVAGNKDLYLGTFSTQEEAAEAYDIAAIRFRGTNAVTNFDMSRYDIATIRFSSHLNPDSEPLAKRIREDIEEMNAAESMNDLAARHGNVFIGSTLESSYPSMTPTLSLSSVQNATHIDKQAAAAGLLNQARILWAKQEDASRTSNLEFTSELSLDFPHVDHKSPCPSMMSTGNMLSQPIGIFSHEPVDGSCRGCMYHSISRAQDTFGKQCQSPPPSVVLQAKRNSCMSDGCCDWESPYAQFISYSSFCDAAT